jgi:hypothetical protein
MLIASLPLLKIFDILRMHEISIDVKDFLQCFDCGGRHVLILGTALTMASSCLRHEFAKMGVNAAGPIVRTGLNTFREQSPLETRLGSGMRPSSSFEGRRQKFLFGLNMN